MRRQPPRRAARQPRPRGAVAGRAVRNGVCVCVTATSVTATRGHWVCIMSVAFDVIACLGSATYFFTALAALGGIAILVHLRLPPWPW